MNSNHKFDEIRYNNQEEKMENMTEENQYNFSAVSTERTQVMILDLTLQ